MITGFVFNFRQFADHFINSGYLPVLKFRNVVFHVVPQLVAMADDVFVPVRVYDRANPVFINEQ